jgi:hypothetical protein
VEEQNLKKIGLEVLETFSIIETAADSKISLGNMDAAEAFATTNTFRDAKAVQTLTKISESNIREYERLKKEPAIVRLLVEDGEGINRTIYISRNSSVHLSSDIKLASYRSPVGALASLPVGDEITIRVGDHKHTYYLIEKVTLHPNKPNNEWDSLDNVFSNHECNSQTVTSFMALLHQDNQDYSHELEAMLSQEKTADIIVNGIKHRVREAMSLRDQPILDRFQDEIFRLPINSQLIILGPPGTGKTTTLIKRLGQKLDAEYLDGYEKRLIGDSNYHLSSWLMFTPSDLLKHYLKEAFNREAVPASDDKIKTWSSYRNDLARNNFGILRSANGGKFTLKPDSIFLSKSVVADPGNWFGSYKNYHWQKLLDQLQQGKKQIEQSSLVSDSQIIIKLTEILLSSSRLSPVATLQQLDRLEKEIKDELDSAKDIAEKLVTEQRNLLFNRDKSVFNNLAIYLEDLSQVDEDDEDLEFDEELDEQVVAPSNTDVQKAVRDYVKFIKSYSRQLYLGRSLSKQSKLSKIKDWLTDERIPDKALLLNIGQQIAYQNGLRRFINVPKRYALSAVNSYAEFRKINIENKAWYSNTSINLPHLDGNEVDGILLLIMQNSRELLSQNFVSRNLELAKFSMLKDFMGLLKNQVLVDEATDFSVMQLGCMYMLTSLNTESFFACGDFNQRVTEEGVINLDKLSWIIPKIINKRINTVYRQSRLLNKFSRTLIENIAGDAESLGELPNDYLHEGLPILLIENVADTKVAAEWISQQIQKIERDLNLLPTIAVLVNEETEVLPMAEMLNQYLQETSLKAFAGEKGQSLGQGTDIRVFDIHHIKGLEFEAVFFVGIDKLAIKNPDVFDRYIYVGATRAATYLGMVCYQTLPGKLDIVRSQCVEAW